MYARSLQAARRADLRLPPPDCLPQLFDIDTVQDLEEWHHHANNMLKRTLSRARTLIRAFSCEKGRRQTGVGGIGNGTKKKDVGSTREDVVRGRSDEGGARCSDDSRRRSGDGVTNGDMAAVVGDGEANEGCSREPCGRTVVAVNGVGTERNERLNYAPMRSEKGAHSERARKVSICGIQSRSSLALLADRILHEHQLLLDAMAETGYTL